MDKALQGIVGSSQTTCPHCDMIFLKPQFDSIIPYRKVLHSFPGTLMMKKNLTQIETEPHLQAPLHLLKLYYVILAYWTFSVL